MQPIRKDIDYINKEILRELAELTAPFCLSIYMPTHRRGSETEQGPIRLKNLLKEAEAQLTALGQRGPDSATLLEPLQALVDDRAFWQHQSHGLAIFYTSDYFETLRLPFEFEELVVVGEQAHIKPLLPLAVANGHFYLLALSQNQVRFWEGTRFQMGEIALKDTPSSLDEAMQHDEFEAQLQFHTGTGSSGNGGRRAMFHGHSDAGDRAVVKENIKRFLNQVDNGVSNHIEPQTTPLVLAGVEEMRGLYGEVSQYDTLVEGGVDGNPDETSPQDLHKAAWPLVEPLFAQAQKDALDAYMHLAGNDDERGAAQLEKVVAGAYFQRVDTLFVTPDSHQWGLFDAQKDTVQVHSEQQPGDIDLYNFALLHTLINGGSVFMLEPDQMPENQSMAAILRY
ncbi:MAG: hypothetical protein KDE54_11465 [Caldilineaceae bacterium]|nr:hypothetical protein [Caldilineaceae bacterium]MCB0095185.1 hypothetical protein [Caldilineaceae bacterium]MCB0140836.1 hypothetical protein [Caldilineaceae bacterium]